ncbi:MULTISPECIES: hypothetical protein [Actinoplanes]|uniref:hypothetical protein n=1 Tax=Actinoplanes TaxID=1865 RepID=UPI0006963AE6|nr:MULTISPECIES: hypothetical protein [Actinoplanes]
MNLWFGLLNRTLNPAVLRLINRGRGPFSLVRHVGRRSGKSYETPLWLIALDGGFLAELTYGPSADWHRNVVAAGGRCQVVHRGTTHEIDRIDPYDPGRALRVFGRPAALVLRLTGRRDFRFLRVTRVKPQVEDE